MTKTQTCGGLVDLLTESRIRPVLSDLKPRTTNCEGSYLRVKKAI
ncbi:hypothetical protein J514_2505 [Acinetobacter sp. 1396970]|nr:hypothetical protein ACINWC487_0509 [Acinetobacter nosocomialis]EXB11106.1 hypothetical protein J514_2505 [Acinetobacter sp. 1396970]